MTSTLVYPADSPADIRAAADVFRSAAVAIDARRRAFSRASASLDTWQGPSAQAAGRWFDRHTTAITSDVGGLGQIATTLDMYAVALDTARVSADMAGEQDRALAVARTSLLTMLPAVRPGSFALPISVLAGASALRSAASAARIAHSESAAAEREVAAAAQAVIDALQVHAPADDGTTRTAHPHTPDPAQPDGTTFGYPGLGPMGQAMCYAIDDPARPPIDPGAGPYASREPSVKDFLNHQAAGAMAMAVIFKWPHASQNLRHYLGATGEPVEQDVDQMLLDDSAFRVDVAKHRQQLVADALAAARTSGTTTSVTFPISSEWRGHTFTSGTDWYYASGSLTYSVQGQITVNPPSGSDDRWTYEMSTAVTTYDRYNWDAYKSTAIGPTTVTDADMASMHTGGIAQEFDMMGMSEVTNEQGRVG